MRCTSADLTAGKTETSVRWKNDEVDTRGYNQEGFYSGEWVWVDAGGFIDHIITSKKRRLAAVPAALSGLEEDSKILALVRSVEGENLNLVRAYDGSVVKSEWGATCPATEDIQGLLNHTKHFSEWRSRVLEGGNPRNITPGEFRPDITLGLGDFVKKKPVTITPDEIVGDKTVAYGAEGIPAAEEQELVDLLDEIEENKQLYGTLQEVGETYEVGPERSSGPSSSSSGPMLLVLGAIVLYAAFS